MVMKPSKMVTSNFRKYKSKRNVEAAIMETNTRTELCVGYSVSSIDTNDEDCFLEREYLCEILQKLNTALKILNPVIDEIISTATIMSDEELGVAKDFPLCSISKQEYRGALTASHIFRDINSELLSKYRNKPLVRGKNFCFPSSNTIISMALSSKKSSKNKNLLEIADRIYIDKELMLKLIELYEMLGETIQKLREKEISSPDKEIQPAPNSTPKATAESTNETLLWETTPEEEPEKNKSCGKRCRYFYIKVFTRIHCSVLSNLIYL